MRSMRPVLGAAVAAALAAGSLPVAAAPAYWRVSGATFRPRQTAVSGNGRYVVFVAHAAPYGTMDPVDDAQVYLTDLRTGRIEPVSVGARGVLGNGASAYPSVSADGRFVVFASEASNLVAGDTNRRRDVFLRDRVLRRTSRVSLDVRGRQLEHGGSAPALSADGSTVAYYTSGNVFASPRFPSYQPPDYGLTLYAVSRAGGPARTRLVGQFATGEPMRVTTCCLSEELAPPALSATGRYVASITGEYGSASAVRNDVYVRDLLARRTTILASYPPFASQDARFRGSPLPGHLTMDSSGGKVLFEQQLWSSETDGIAGGRRLLLWHVRTGRVEQVDDANRTVTDPSGLVGDKSDSQGSYASESAISADGRWIVYTRTEVFARYDTGTNYLFFDGPFDGRTYDDLDTTRRVLKREVATGATDAIVVCDPLPQACGSSWAPSISADGAVVAFVTSASLDTADPDTPAELDPGITVDAGEPTRSSVAPEQTVRQADRSQYPYDVYVRKG